MKHRIIVAAVIHNGHKILLGKKSPGRGPYPDAWHIPGGGVNLGEETCEEAILREIQEEAHIQVKNLEKVQWNTDIEPDKHGEPTYYVFLVYRCDYESGEIHAGDDLEDLQWVSIQELTNYNLNRPTSIYFKALGYI